MMMMRGKQFFWAAVLAVAAIVLLCLPHGTDAWLSSSSSSLTSSSCNGRRRRRSDLHRSVCRLPFPLAAHAFAENTDDDDYNFNSNISQKRSDNDPVAEGVRLNKCFKATHSRRQADVLIRTPGRVTINGEPPEGKGDRVIPGKDRVELDGVPIDWEQLAVPQNYNQNQRQQQQQQYVYLKYWKPRGVVCTTDRRMDGNIIDALMDAGYRPPHRVYPVGRLDKDSHGLILLTSDGRVTNSVLRSRRKKDKVYHVFIASPISPEHVTELADGVVITTVAQRDGGRKAEPLTARTQPCKVECNRNDPRLLRFTIQEGRNRQIRRMLEVVGHRVLELKRAEFMGIGLDGLDGHDTYCELDETEMSLLLKAVEEAEQEENDMASISPHNEW